MSDDWQQSHDAMMSNINLVAERHLNMTWARDNLDIIASLRPGPNGEPARCVVVPREPTLEMIAAGQDAHDDCIDSGFGSDADGNRHDYTIISPDAPAKVYRAMLAAAQEPTRHD